MRSATAINVSGSLGRSRGSEPEAVGLAAGLAASSPPQATATAITATSDTESVSPRK
jgi:hypothetical protein